MTRPTPGFERPVRPERPSIGMTRPTPGFERPVGGGDRPDGGGTLPGGGDRPTLGGNRPGGNRPGIGGGDRPAIGMTKPAPGFERPVFGGDRPGGDGDRPWFGGNRPGGNRPWDRPDGWNRPGIGGNRPNIGGDVWNNVGNDNSINTSVNNWTTNQNWYTNVNNTQVGVGRPWGGWGYGGGYGGWGLGGYGGWGNSWQSNYVNPGYGWYNGCWNGGWNNGWGSSWWTPFALGAATTGLVTTAANWGLGSGLLGYANGYANPYYTSVPATVVAASPYDYSQPIVVNNYIPVETPTAVVADAPAQAAAPPVEPPQPDTTGLADEALAAFRRRDYGAALAKLDRAVQRSPGDTVLHEVRGLCLFALGRYPEAAAVLNAVLAVAPGMDWTTLSGLYDDVDDYTQQLRNLEAACRADQLSAANHFVLAYHYLVGGHADLAADALEVVVEQQPGDAVAKRLLDAIVPPEPPAPAGKATGTDGAGAVNGGETKAEPRDGAEAAKAAPETDLVGRWKAVMGDDAIELVVAEDFTFTWKAVPKGKPAVELTGTLSTTADIIALESEKAGAMVAKVKSQGPDAFEFSLAGAPKDAPPLQFERQK